MPISGFIPTPILRRIRAVKDHLAVRNFKPFVARHNYAEFDLFVHIEDKVGKLWYDHDWKELPEHTLLRTVKLKPGAKVFDLGAHQAIVALMVSRMVGESGSVLAVEAGQHNFEIAAKNKEANAAHNLTILCAAVAEKNGTISFSDGMNGRIGPGVSRAAYSVDDLAARFGTPDVVIVDIEGYELNALRGARKTLSAKPDWYVEVHSTCGLEAAGGTPEEVVTLLRDAGYTLFIQDDIHYGRPFRPLDNIPHQWFQLVATAR